MTPSSNPFCTRHVRPGAMPFVFAGDEGLSDLLERLAASGFRGEIVGPHGSGKSTLLADVAAALAERGRIVGRFTLTSGERRLPGAWRAAAASADVLLVDGYEQLSWWARLSVQHFCRRGGLVVTSHRGTGLPRLATTAPSAALAWRLVQARYEGTEPLVDRNEVEAAFARRGGNLREVFFDLYDLHEERTPRAAGLSV